MSEPVICAVATGASVGAIACIRMSGKGAFEIADKIFYSFDGKKAGQMQGHTCAYGKILDGEGKRVDDALLTVFVAPRSYTGEDIVEISCHGGGYVRQKVVRLCLENGAVPASQGEFTKRAFLNGKLSLTQAEAVADIISSDGERLLRSANNARGGRLNLLIEDCRQRLIAIDGDLAAWVDYPEEDLPDIEPDALTASLEYISEKLKKLVKDYDTGKILKEGIACAICGKPNVGKSTLMNLLSGFSRSIVTDIAGTTRDVVEEAVRLSDDIVLRLFDTAGIRETSDEVEKIGVSLARKKLEECDLALAVFDSSSELTEEDESLLKHLDMMKTIIIINKTDLERKLPVDAFKMCECEMVELSANRPEGIEILKRAIEDTIFKKGISSVADTEIFANERQLGCCQRSLDACMRALEAVKMGVSYDCVTVEIEEAISALLELTGEKTTEAVVNEVFSRFCVGK